MDYFDFIAYLIMSGVQEKFISELAERMLALFEQGCKNPDEYEVLTRLSRVEALRIAEKHNKELPKATREAFEKALNREDETLLNIFNNAFGDRDHLTNLATNIANNTAVGMSEILRRQNIAFANTQADIWHKVTADAILALASGKGEEKTLEDAVKKLANNCLATVDYKSGNRTQIDNAVRRHLVTQANQARNRLLFHRMDEWECDLVFTSAHYGARPDHAEWQGKVYSRSGTSKKYPSLVESTGYGTVTGLCGVNCRHIMTPYVEGYSKLPNTDYSSKERLTGLSSDEYYKEDQKLRRIECQIRSSKREITALEKAGLDSHEVKIKLRKQQAKARKLCKEHSLQRRRNREKVYATSRTQGVRWKNIKFDDFFENMGSLEGMDAEQRKKEIKARFAEYTKGKQVQHVNLKPSLLYSKLEYDKSRDAIIRSNLTPEIYAHDILAKHGIGAKILKEETQGGSNIDLLISVGGKSVLAEIKCPSSNTKGAAKDSNRFIERNLSKIFKQFCNCDSENNDGRVVGVISLKDRHFPSTEEDMLKTIKLKMREKHVSNLILIDSNARAKFSYWK